MITYDLITENNILETIFKDMIDPRDIIDFMKEVNSNKQLPRSLNVIIDVRDADFVFEPIKIQHIVKANFRMNRSFKKIKNAILTNNPDDATLTLFHQYAKGSQNYHVKLFKDRDQAQQWLKSSD